MLYALDLLGTIVFAIAGALKAKHAKLDIFGVMVIAVITAMGGGTLRDTLLGRTPVFWMLDTNYLLLAIGSAIVSFITMRNREPQRRLMLILDALGLGVFTVIGVDIALNMALSPLVAIIMGIMTGTFGGLIRDMLLSEIPLILHREIYATASLIGAIVYVIALQLPINDGVSAFAGAGMIFLARIIALRQNWSLPKFEHPERLDT